MTTYTITEAQRQKLIDYLSGTNNFYMRASLTMLQSLEPDAQHGEPVAWYEYSPSTNAWFLAYSDNPRAKTRPLVFGDVAAPAPMRILTDAERAEREKARDK